MFKRSFLIILDGWGIGSKPESDAIAQANTPFFDHLIQKYPHSTLVTHGLNVGLPDGQMGNSEVGHLNLGAGRIVYQDLAKINKSISDKQFEKNPELINLARYCNQNQKACHLIGMLSDGGVHSHILHLKAIIEALEVQNVQEIYIHAILDGRDTDPHSGFNFLKDLENFLIGRKAIISTIIGRYYAMDRDHRWERTQKAYELYVHGKGQHVISALAAIEKSYADKITDEFVDAFKIGDLEQGLIKDGDAVLCFNFRTDRLRQLTQVLSQEDLPQFGMKKKALYFVTMARYDNSFDNIQVLFDKEDLRNTLGETLSRYGMTQLRIAETEKYPHVSFFFSGGREKAFSGEKRILIPSPKVATYDLQAEMSAVEVTDHVIQEIDASLPDFICLNYANADMVGHTGVFNAELIAVETVDRCLARLIPVALANAYACIILADHGNGEYMINEDGTPNTAHTKNPVPCILITNASDLKINNGILADIAPTILKLMALPIPVEMDGNSLIIKS